MKNMLAAIRRQYGSPETLKLLSVPRPVPKDDELLIKVKATTVNRTDCANLSASPFFMRLLLGLVKPKRIITGTDLAGEVLDFGASVKTYKKGDRLMAFCDLGLSSHANYCCVKEEDLFPIPKGIDFEEAVAAIEGAHYAYGIVNRISINKGQRVFINGASGAIGSALLQLLRLQDIHIAVSCRAEHREILIERGADYVVDYEKEEFTARKEEFDFVFDAVGKSSFAACKSILKPQGEYISTELGAFAQNVFYSLITPMGKGRKVRFPIPFSVKESMTYFLPYLENGQYRPIVDKVYNLKDIAAAFDYVLSGQKFANVLLRMDGDKK